MLILRSRLFAKHVHLFKQQCDIVLKTYVASVLDVSEICCKCVCADVVKVDRDVAYVIMVIHVCCKLLFPIFQLFFPDVCCKCVYLDVAYVSHICCKVFYLDVAYALQ